LSFGLRAASVLAEASDDDLYNLACVYAQAIPAVRKDARLSPVEQEKAEEEYASAAVLLLDRLERADYFKTPQRRDHLSKADPDLEPLRWRSEFQRLLTRPSARASMP
jgi:hypothetical protein